MIHVYAVLTQAFCEANLGYQSGANKFGYGVTLNGLYVTSTNALNEFPELFSSLLPLPLVSLEAGDIEIWYSDEPPSVEQIVNAAIKRAENKGVELFKKIRRENVLLGIESSTIDGIPATDVVLERGSLIMDALLSGSTKAAIRLCKAFPENQKDPTFLNNTRLLAIVNELEAFHGMPLSVEL